MTQQQEKEVALWNQLIKRNYDAEYGYKEAAERSEDPTLKAFFQTKVEERYKFGHDIKPFIALDGGEPNKGTSIVGDIHRQFMKIKDLVTGADDTAIIEECIRGEKVALEDYEKAIADEYTGPATKDTLRMHATAIRNSIERLEQMQTVTK